MKSLAYTRTVLGLAASAAWLALPEAASACATCYGAADSAATKGMNNAILVLVGFVGILWIGVGRMIWDFRKRSKKLEKLARPQLRLIHGEKR
jgi:uncharacterized iron-regulated membrane protein